MAKIDSEALVKLSNLVELDYTIQIKRFVNQFEVTVWPNCASTIKMEHHHYLGDTLTEAILKIKT